MHSGMVCNKCQKTSKSSDGFYFFFCFFSQHVYQSDAQRLQSQAGLTMAAG